jgi:hypothetical protein
LRCGRLATDGITDLGFKGTQEAREIGLRIPDQFRFVTGRDEELKRLSPRGPTS